MNDTVRMGKCAISNLVTLLLCIVLFNVVYLDLLHNIVHINMHIFGPLLAHHAYFYRVLPIIFTFGIHFRFRTFINFVRFSNLEI